MAGLWISLLWSGTGADPEPDGFAFAESGIDRNLPLGLGDSEYTLYADGRFFSQQQCQLSGYS